MSWWSAASPDDGSRWASRRGLALTLRSFVLLAPVGVSILAALAAIRLVPPPADVGERLGWAAGVVVVCSVFAWPTRRMLRRLLPLATLLELSILFPGRAPRRWQVAREAGSIKHLEILAAGVPDADPGKAAITILALVASLARHDAITRGHSERVRIFADMIGEEMGLPRADRDRLRWAALIHDVGKLDVPGRLLRKRGRPTPAEWQSLRNHPLAGARIAAPLEDWLGEYAAVVLQHHERFDGSGYPAGLRGEEISLGARIVGLADAFETMTAARPYKRAFSRAAALREVVNCSGTHFDPAVVRALLSVSLPRLRRALGPASLVGQLPVVATAQAGGLPAVAGGVARGAGAVLVGGVVGAVVAGASGPASDGGPAAGTQQGQAAVPQPRTPSGDLLSPDRPDAALSPSGVAAASGATPDAASGGPSTSNGPPVTDGGSGATTSGPVQSAPAAGPTSSASSGGLTGAVGGVTQAVSGTLAQASSSLGTTVTGVTGTVDGVGSTLTGVLGGSSTSPSPSPSPDPSPTPSPDP